MGQHWHLQRDDGIKQIFAHFFYSCVAAISDRGPPKADKVKARRRISFNSPGHVHFLTFSCFRHAHILADENACILLAGALNAARERHDFDLWAYVFMPDHVHLLIRPRGDSYSISRILKAIKGPFARGHVDYCRRNHPESLRQLQMRTQFGPKCRVWERGGGYDRNLITREYIRRAIDYIEFNPVRAGMVSDAENWRWSSARARAGFSNVPARIDEVNWECTDDAQMGMSR